MPNDQSNLTTLEALTKSAEARTPRPAPAVVTAGSGLIDLHAMEQSARESVQAPKPVTLPARDLPRSPRAATTDSEILIAVEAKKKRKRLIFGSVVAGAAVLAIAFTVAFTGSNPEVKPTAAAVAAPSPPPQAPAPTPQTAPEVMKPAPVAPQAAVAAAAPSPPTAKGHAAKGRRPVKPSKGGPKLTKINAAGNVTH
jgi:hypothetical protein